MPALARPSAPAPALARGPAAEGLVFRGAIYGGSGYADGNLDLLAGLDSMPRAEALPIQLAPIGPQQDSEQLLPPARRRELERLQRRRLELARSVYYQCCPAPDFDLQNEARVCIGRTAFETDTLPRGWRERCNAMDQVWV
ncbi:MAG: hypothetical protein ACRD1E_02820, partial [Terriglobales bacterium]